jgi:hypothetical protein
MSSSVNSMESIQPQLERVQRRAFLAGAIAVVLCVIFGFLNKEQFLRSYLFAYIYWLTIPLGCTAILMLHNMTGGWWGYPIRRLLEAGTRTFALMAVLFVPVWLGMSHLYPWVQTPIKTWYLNPRFFTVRAVIYFGIWLTLSHFLNKWSSEQDKTGDPKLLTRLETISAPGLILWGIAVTYASIDWVMSLDPHWFSTMFGMIFMIIGALGAMSFVIFVLRMLSEYEPVKAIVTASQFNDLGNLLLTFVMLWAYLSFSQFIIIWAGNLKNEAPWYLTRAFGAWALIAVFLILLNFAIPFLLLLQRPMKRNLGALSMISGMLIVMGFLNVYWLIMPSLESDGPHFHPTDFLALIGIGGLWVGTFFWQLRKWPMLPQHDPRFEGALQHEHGD